jgi:hypothetical protein
VDLDGMDLDGVDLELALGLGLGFATTAGPFFVGWGDGSLKSSTLTIHAFRFFDSLITLSLTDYEPRQYKTNKNSSRYIRVKTKQDSSRYISVKTNKDSSRYISVKTNKYNSLYIKTNKGSSMITH